MSKIEWTDVTFNPVTGCWGPGGTAEEPKWCSYCYAKPMAKRLKAMGQEKYAAGFVPRFHRSELARPHGWKKPRKIFVCSMADLFGDWVGSDTIQHILEVAWQCHQHTFQFLTKNPSRLTEKFDWPPNAWVGVTATRQSELDAAVKALATVQAPVHFISAEPLLGPIRLRTTDALWVDWLIIGQQTGRGAKPIDPAWVHQLTDDALANEVPVFHKDNLGEHAMLREFPVI